MEECKLLKDLNPHKPIEPDNIAASEVVYRAPGSTANLSDLNVTKGKGVTSWMDDSKCHIHMQEEKQ